MTADERMLAYLVRRLGVDRVVELARAVPVDEPAPRGARALCGTAPTERQQQVLDEIERSYAARGYAPTLRELGQALGIKSTNGVKDHLRALEKKGLVKFEPWKTRALTVVRG